MLLDNKKHLKAKQYQCITVDEETHLFQPVGAEVEDVEIDPVQLVVDFAKLIGEYAKCSRLRVYQAPWPYEIAPGRRNWIYRLNKQIYEEQIQMRKVLLEFINKYGLFGIMNDDVLAYDYNHLNEDGTYYIESNYPETAYLYRNDAAQVRSIPYVEYIKPFFPDVPAEQAIKLKGADRARHYSECMEDILQNKRMLACAEYIAGIDKQRSKSPLIIQGMNAVLSFKKDVPIYDIKYRSLIEYCHSIFFLNEIAGESRSVRICQYKKCHKPFTDRNSKYCCPDCMVKANKRSTKKGEKDNG